MVRSTHQMRMAETRMSFIAAVGVADDISMNLSAYELAQLNAELSSMYAGKLANYRDLKEAQWT